MNHDVEAEEIRQVLLDAVEVSRRKQIFEVLNAAYDLVVEYSQKQNMNRDDFKKHFSGIADDYKMAKLRYEVVKDAQAENLKQSRSKI